jgi:hypothetical protein
MRCSQYPWHRRQNCSSCGGFNCDAYPMIAFPLCYGVKCGLIFDVRSHELVTHLRVCRDQSLVYHRFRLREFSRYIYIYIYIYMALENRSAAPGADLRGQRHITIGATLCTKCGAPHLVREIRTSGLMSGDGRRGESDRPSHRAHPRLYGLLPSGHTRARTGVRPLLPHCIFMIVGSSASKAELANQRGKATLHGKRNLK